MSKTSRLICDIRKRQLWLHARLIHPGNPAVAYDGLLAKIDTGASVSVIPKAAVDWFARETPLADLGRVSTRLGDGRLIEAPAYLVDIMLTDAYDSTWSLEYALYPEDCPGYLALPRDSVLLGMDVLSLCDRAVYSGVAHRAFVTLPAQTLFKPLDR